MALPPLVVLEALMPRAFQLLVAPLRRYWYPLAPLVSVQAWDWLPARLERWTIAEPFASAGADTVRNSWLCQFRILNHRVAAGAAAIRAWTSARLSGGPRSDAA